MKIGYVLLKYAPIHVARGTKAFLQSWNIQLLDWPALSPDLSPIENLWDILTAKVYAHVKQYDTFKQVKSAIVQRGRKFN